MHPVLPRRRVRLRPVAARQAAGRRHRAAVREAEGLTVVLPRDEADSPGAALRLRRRLDHPAGALLAGSRGPDGRRRRGPDRSRRSAATSWPASTMTTCWCRWRTPTGRWKSCTSWPPKARTAAANRRRRSGCAPNGREDRAAILALTAAAFAVSPVTGLPVDGEPEEVGLLRRLFDCDGVPAGVQHRRGTRRRDRGACDQHPRMGGGAGAAGARADRGGAAAAAPRHRHRAHEGDRGAGQRGGGAGDRAAGQP